MRSDSGYDDDEQVDDAKDPDDCIKMVKKECPGASAARTGVPRRVSRPVAR